MVEASILTKKKSLKKTIAYFLRGIKKANTLNQLKYLHNMYKTLTKKKLCKYLLETEKKKH